MIRDPKDFRRRITTFERRFFEKHTKAAFGVCSGHDCYRMPTIAVLGGYSRNAFCDECAVRLGYPTGRQVKAAIARKDD